MDSSIGQTDNAPLKRMRADDEATDNHHTFKKAAVQIDKVPTRLAASIRNLAVLATPGGAMMLSAKVRASLESAISHARATVAQTKSLPTLPADLKKESSELLHEMRQKLAGITERGRTIGETCRGRAGDGVTRRSGFADRLGSREARQLADEVDGYLGSEKIELGTLDSTISELDKLNNQIRTISSEIQSVSGQLRVITDQIRHVKQEHEERELIRQACKKKATALRDLIVQTTNMYDNLDFEVDQILEDMFHIGQDGEMIADRAVMVDHRVGRFEELLCCTNAPPAVAVLETVIDSVFEDLRLHLGLK